MHGKDLTESLPKPKYAPYFHIIHVKEAVNKKNYFSKGTTFQFPLRLIYGWSGIKEFYISDLPEHSSDFLPNFAKIMLRQ